MLEKNTTNKMDLNIQMFAEAAANVDDDSSNVTEPSTTTDDAGSEEEIEFTDGTPAPEGTVVQPVVNEKKQTTKAFSERLKQETQRIARESEEKRIEELNKVAVKRGFKDWKELEEFDQNERIESLGIKDPTTFKTIVDDAVSKNPIVIEAKRVIDSQRQREQEAALNNAIDEIHKIDSDINSVDDLLHLENYTEFYDLVNKGYRLQDAYKIVAFDKISNKKAAGAAQNVMTNINSKNHMKTTTGTQTNEVVIPDDIMASYKKNNPQMSDKDIREHYTRFLGGK